MIFFWTLLRTMRSTVIPSTFICLNCVTLRWTIQDVAPTRHCSCLGRRCTQASWPGWIPALPEQTGAASRVAYPWWTWHFCLLNVTGLHRKYCEVKGDFRPCHLAGLTNTMWGYNYNYISKEKKHKYIMLMCLPLVAPQILRGQRWRPCHLAGLTQCEVRITIT